MSDPVGLIGASGGMPDAQRASQQPSQAHDGPTFKDLLIKNIDEVNKLQQDATRAVEDLAAGRRTDIEGVLLATAKADTAFKALQATRNKVVEAYQEIQRMPV
jgi:flagellar hook-basal body complex protein FliE